MTKPGQLEQNSDISIWTCPSRRKIDGSKIKTINDVQLIFSAIAMTVDDTNELYKQLEHLFQDLEQEKEKQNDRQI